MPSVKSQLKKQKNCNDREKTSILLNLIDSASVKDLLIISEHIDGDKELSNALLAKAISYVNSTNSKERHLALQVLNEETSDEVEKIFIAAVSDSVDKISMYAIKHLAKSKNTGAVEAICEVLKRDKIMIVSTAIEALVKIGDSRAVLPITKLLKGSFMIKDYAIDALIAFRDPQAISFIIDAHRIDKDLAQKIKLEKALGEIDPIGQIDTLFKWYKEAEIPKQKSTIRKILFSIENPIVYNYIPQLENWTPEALIETIEKMSHSDDFEATTFILNNSIFKEFNLTWINNGWVNKVHVAAAKALLNFPQKQILELLKLNENNVIAKKSNILLSIYHDFEVNVIRGINDSECLDILNMLVLHEKKKIREAAQQAIDNILS